ncbi:DUF1674 domain-containing protein [Steroidobacter cummioxidans]|uniref:DUF1674 domain-containing protein n=1 Tax=Steroidobacter cummioxidans TaxID=1803913 RepID=UPI000E323BC3
MPDTNLRPDSPAGAERPRQDVSAATETGTEPRAPGAAGEQAPKEIGGRDGPEPTRFGDWEKAGRCIDF